MSAFTQFSTARMPDEYKGLSVNHADPEPVADSLDYQFPEGAVAALDVALGLGRPLLVTGEPGVGKTQLGFAVARRLGLERAYYFVTRSTSEARDLFYSYDSLGRFRDSQLKVEDASTGDYIAYQGLGAAILDACDVSQIAPLLQGKRHGWQPLKKPARSLVVIDEIDKAGRDFANDLLAEFETMAFSVPELTATINGIRNVPQTPRLDRKLRPVVIVTSNSERALPDAFLRRCVYLNIAFPQPHDKIEKILVANLGDAGSGGLMEQLVKLTVALRDNPGIIKKPSISEVVDAARVLSADGIVEAERWNMAASTLAKLKPDLETLDRIMSDMLLKTPGG